MSLVSVFMTGRLLWFPTLFLVRDAQRRGFFGKTWEKTVSERVISERRVRSEGCSLPWHKLHMKQKKREEGEIKTKQSLTNSH